MITFAWPWVFLLLPLPLLARWLLPPADPQIGKALHLPFYTQLPASGGGVGHSNDRLGSILAVLAWVLLVIAAARPQWLDDPVDLPLAGRDLFHSAAVDRNSEQVRRAADPRGEVDVLAVRRPTR